MEQESNLSKRPRGFRYACFTGYYVLTRRRSLLQCVDRLDALHRAPRPTIDGQVRRNLVELLSHASKRVPYYRELLDGEPISETTIVSLLREMPILTKNIMREQGSRLVSEDQHRGLRWNTSGGSTGEPIRLLQDQGMRRFGRATELLFMRWAGHRWGEPHLLIWGVPQEAFREKTSLHEKIFRLIHNETYLNCYRITDETLHSWVGSINSLRPTLIEAYADAIYELSRMVLDEGLSVVRPRAIIASAGVLTPDMKQVITGAFGCPVLNRYGSREVGNVACSCLINDELHIDEYTCYVEVVDETGNQCEDGVEGDILVTLLTNRTMPLIRYKIEDRGVWASGACKCGRTTRRLVTVVGRQSDYLVASDGSKINGTALTTLLYPVAGIRRYQYRQTDMDRVVLAVVPREEVTVDSLRQEIQEPLRKLRTMLGTVGADLEIVNDIPPSPSGKYRYVLNDLVKKQATPCV